MFMGFKTGGGTFTGVQFNAAGVVVTTDGTSAPMAGLTRAGCLAYAATNGWTAFATW